MKAIKNSKSIDPLEEIWELERVAKSASLISESDIINKRIRNNNDWSLMPNLGIVSTVYPSYLCANTLPYPKFPE